MATDDIANIWIDLLLDNAYVYVTDNEASSANDSLFYQNLSDDSSAYSISSGKNNNLSSRLLFARRHNLTGLYPPPGSFRLALDMFTHYLTPTFVAVGVLGNITCLLVFSLSYLKTLSSNLYLCTLALANTAFLLALAFAWLHRAGLASVYEWPGACQLVVYVMHVSSFCSVWNVLAFTAERYISVYYSLRKDALCSRRMAVAFVVCSTTFALVLCSYTLWTHAPVYIGSQAVCSHLHQHYDIITIMTAVDTLCSVGLPSTIIVFLNARIIVKLHQYQQLRRSAVAVELLDEYIPLSPLPPTNLRISMRASVSADGMQIRFSNRNHRVADHNLQHHQQKLKQKHVVVSENIVNRQQIIVAPLSADNSMRKVPLMLSRSIPITWDSACGLNCSCMPASQGRLTLFSTERSRFTSLTSEQERVVALMLDGRRGLRGEGGGGEGGDSEGDDILSLVGCGRVTQVNNTYARAALSDTCSGPRNTPSAESGAELQQQQRQGQGHSPTATTTSAPAAQTAVGCSKRKQATFIVRGRSQMRTARMLLILSSVFVMLSLPSQVLRVYIFVGKSSKHHQEWLETFDLCRFLNFAINVFVYAACGRSFRAGLARLCRRCVAWVRRRCATCQPRHRHCKTTGREDST